MTNHLGTLADPHTGETVTITAEPLPRDIGYKKACGCTGDLRTATTDKAWPERDLFFLEASNGRLFAEMHLDRDGWWVTTDQSWRPYSRAGRVAGFFIQLGAGLSNGYPLRDVITYAFWWGLWPERAVKRLDRDCARGCGND